MSILSQEIALDPLTRGYAGMTNDQLYTDIFVTKYRTKTVAKSPWKIADLMGYESLVKWETTLDTDAKLGWKFFFAALQSGEEVDMAGNPVMSVVLNKARSASPDIISSDEKDAIIAFCTKRITRAEELGIPERHAGDVGIERNIGA